MILFKNSYNAEIFIVSGKQLVFGTPDIKLSVSFEQKIL